MQSMLPSKLPPLICRDQKFIDPQGREVILHGVNLVNKDPMVGYIGAETAETFAILRRWGFNCVRLGVIWDGLEPQPGIYNERYLEQIEQQVTWAGENGLYVLLDMHQDLYSVCFSDGAPEWATLTGDQPHTEIGFVWDDAYFTSPAVQTALDNFWSDTPAPDGLGLQDHYARAWGKVAERFSTSPIVIGYDLMNEPFPGSSAAASQWMIFEKGAELLAEIDGPGAPSAEDLAMQWLNPQGRKVLLERMRDIPLFSQAIDVTYPVYAEFEQGQLMGLYQRAAEAIRRVDSHHILFMESSMGANMGVYSAIQPLHSEGKRLPQQSYAPHGYDLVVDTPYLADASPERIALIFQRHAETSRRLGMPMLVGEWGAFNREAQDTLPVAWEYSRQFERLLCSDTYWHYASDLEQFPVFQAISRPYPERVAGALVSYHFCPEDDSFTCSWEETLPASAPTIIFIPGWLNLASHPIQLTPEGTGYHIIGDENSTRLSVPPMPQPGLRTLTIHHSDPV